MKIFNLRKLSLVTSVTFSAVFFRWNENLVLYCDPEVFTGTLPVLYSVSWIFCFFKGTVSLYQSWDEVLE
jgi:hypothetical protein